LKTWRDREKAKEQYFQARDEGKDATQSHDERNDAASIALAISRRLIAVVKFKNILYIEAGLEMLALAMAISSEVSCNIHICQVL
jgi:hypothetical protein